MNNQPNHNPRREMEPLPTRKKRVKRIAINELNYENIRFEGRQDEINTLKLCLNRLIADGGNSNKTKELVLIKGYSGTGKSTLAYTLNQHVSKMPKAMFAHGKFSLNHAAEPYSGVAGAFSEIAQALHGDEEFLANINDPVLSESVASEIQLLKTIVPQLQGLIPVDKMPTGSEMETFDFAAGVERRKYAFRILTRVFASYFCPLILVLDDLQWADASSLAVLEFLISDIQNTCPLMIIGCYRSNEVDEDHILHSKIQSLSSKEQNFRFNMTTIDLGSLKVADVNKIIMSMLSLSNEKRTKALAEICLKRTLGNPLFLIEFVSMLKDDGLLMFDMINMQWSWDCDLIDESAVSTSSVVELLGSRMRRLPEDGQLLLQYAACLDGPSFNFSKLEILWEKHGKISSPASDPKEADNDLAALLQLLERNDFIENEGDLKYKWAHDKVQEAASSLGMPLQFEIGLVLYNFLSPEELEDSLFYVADLINHGDVKQRSGFIELYLRAGKKAQSLGLFHGAVTYVKRGIELLPETKWGTHRFLTLALHTLGAEVMLAIARYHDMEIYCNEILDHDGCSILEKAQLYTMKLHKLSSVDCKYSEAIEFALVALRELGCRLVFRKTTMAIQAPISLLRAIRMAKKIDCGVAEKQMDDPKERFIMNLLCRVVNTSFFVHDDNIFLLAVSTMIQRTIRKGVSGTSGFSYACLSLVVGSGLGDFATSRRFAEISSVLVQKNDSLNYHGTGPTEMTLYSFVFPWTRSLQSCFLESTFVYQRCMLTGNVECAMWTLLNRDLLLPFHMGSPIESLLAKCESVLAQAEEFKQQDQCTCIRILQKLLQHLVRRPGMQPRLKGEVFDRSSLGDLSSKINSATANSFDLMLFNFLGYHDLAADMAIDAGDNYAKHVPGDHINMMESFHRGLALYVMASKTKQRKFLKAARPILKTMHSWIKKGNPNVTHYHAFLSAEQASIEKDYAKADLLYKQAIAISARTGYIHLAALCNERYASFLLQSDINKEDEAEYRIGEAIRYYELWGASAKVLEMNNSFKGKCVSSTAMGETVTTVLM